MRSLLAALAVTGFLALVGLADEKKDADKKDAPKKDDAAKKDAAKKDGAKKPAPKGVPPTVAALKYGDHERQVLDFWQAKSDTPTPLILMIHGGGWQGGDKAGYAS